jgi:endonuclease YncB( thermonuclease family)
VAAPSPTIPAVHDGDSFHANLDLGMGVWQHELMVRFNSGNAAELGSDAGAAARANLRSILQEGTKLVLHSVQWDKYGGRIDADVYLSDGTDLVQKLIADQWLAPWDGSGARPTPPWPRTVSP